MDALPPNTVIVHMIPAENSKASGDITFIQKGKTLVIEGHLHGLTPGAHGFHIHENGSCEDHAEFKEAGGHFNPTNVKHGSIRNGHLGDLGNIYANKNGDANFTIKVHKINIKDNDKSSILHRTVMVHANKDDLKTDPSGNSGSRILCGVIE